MPLRQLLLERTRSDNNCYRGSKRYVNRATATCWLRSVPETVKHCRSSESKATEKYASWAQRKIATTKVSFQSVGLKGADARKTFALFVFEQQFVSLRLKLCPLHDHNDFAASTTCAASMPRSFITSVPGALKPNSRSPTTLPSRPTY